MRLRVRQDNREPNVTGTAGVSFATQLVSSTGVSVAGSGLDLTVPLPPRFWIIPLREPKSLKLKEGPRPSVSPRRSGKRREKPTGAAFDIQDIFAAMQRHVGGAAAERHVVFQKIAAAEPQAQAPLKLVGTRGSAPRPTKKSYDLDLDEFQFD